MLPSSEELGSLPSELSIVDLCISVPSSELPISVLSVELSAGKVVGGNEEGGVSGVAGVGSLSSVSAEASTDEPTLVGGASVVGAKELAIVGLATTERFVDSGDSCDDSSDSVEIEVTSIVSTVSSAVGAVVGAPVGLEVTVSDRSVDAGSAVGVVVASSESG